MKRDHQREKQILVAQLNLSLIKIEGPVGKPETLKKTSNGVPYLPAGRSRKRGP